jgi:hypothetical protein
MEVPMSQMKQLIIIAMALFIVDALVLNQGTIAAIAFMVILIWLLPKAIFLKFKKKSPIDPLMKSAIFGVMALAVFTANFTNNKIAKYHAINLIIAVEKYHQATDRYPEKLRDLVPEYIPTVPVAKYTLAFNEFSYVNYQGTASLLYVVFPPFGRAMYNFNRKSWGYLD